MEPVIGLLQKLLGDGQIDQCGIDVLMAEIGRQIGQPRFDIDPSLVPGQHAMADEGVPYVMQPGAFSTERWLQAATADHLRQQMFQSHPAVTPLSLVIPE